MTVKKVRKIRRRRGKGTSSKMYFGIEVQDAIISTQSEPDEKQKEKIFVEIIRPAFDKLAENLIFIYGFATPNEPFEHLKNDCISFLYETIGKWDSTRGTKAFSYFNVVAKNWLIINSRQRKKRNMRHVSVDDMKSMSSAQKEIFSKHDILPAPDEILIQRNFRSEIMTLLVEIQRRVNSETEKLCINSVITVFESIDDLDFLNKRAVFVYVRDISGLTPKQLSVAMSTIRKHYRELTHGGGEFDIF